MYRRVLVCSNTSVQSQQTNRALRMHRETVCIEKTAVSCECKVAARCSHFIALTGHRREHRMLGIAAGCRRWHAAGVLLRNVAIELAYFRRQTSTDAPDAAEKRLADSSTHSESFCSISSDGSAAAGVFGSAMAASMQRTQQQKTCRERGASTGSTVAPHTAPPENRRRWGSRPAH